MLFPSLDGLHGGSDAASSAPPAFRTLTSATSTTSTITVTRPPQIQENDFLLVVVDTLKQTATATAPADPVAWTAYTDVGGAGVASTSFHAFWFYKFASAAEPSSYAFVVSNTGGGTATLVAYSGVRVASPIDTGASQLVPTGTTFTAPSVTTTIANDLLVATFVSGNSPATPKWTTPTDMTARNTTGLILVTDAPWPTPGATNAETATCSFNATGATLTLALAPQ